jgi:hypothetical protein
LREFKEIDFLELHPDWIIYFPRDSQFQGPDEMFAWMEHQDNTTLEGISIDLRATYARARLFRVTYPPDHPPKGPLPDIP